jgi:hypothetical protein
MRRFVEEQFAFAHSYELSGLTIADIRRRLSVSEQTFCP